MSTVPRQEARQQTGEEDVLIYDGECRLCVTARAGIERLGRNDAVRYIPYQSEEAACRLGAAYRGGVRPDVAYMVDRNGRIVEGLDAFVPLLPGLPGGRLLLALLRFPLGRRLAHLFYRIIARNRYRWFGAVQPK